MTHVPRLVAITAAVALAGCAVQDDMAPELKRANAALKAEAQRKNN